MDFPRNINLEKLFGSYTPQTSHMGSQQGTEGASPGPYSPSVLILHIQRRLECFCLKKKVCLCKYLNIYWELK